MVDFGVSRLVPPGGGMGTRVGSPPYVGGCSSWAL